MDIIKHPVRPWCSAGCTLSCDTLLHRMALCMWSGTHMWHVMLMQFSSLTCIANLKKCLHIMLYDFTTGGNRSLFLLYNSIKALSSWPFFNASGLRVISLWYELPVFLFFLNEASLISAGSLLSDEAVVLSFAGIQASRDTMASFVVSLPFFSFFIFSLRWGFVSVNFSRNPPSWCLTHCHSSVTFSSFKLLIVLTYYAEHNKKQNQNNICMHFLHSPLSPMRYITAYTLKN